MRGAIFDMDGLLIDSERVWQRVWHELAEERGLTLPDTFAAEICGTGLAESLAVLSRHFHTDAPEEVSRACAARVYRIEEGGVPLLPGAALIRAGLRARGFRMAVASSSGPDMIRVNLRYNGIEHYFDKLVSGRAVKNGKPAPDIFLFAAKELGLPPEECYVFEDSFNGVEAGYRAGCRTIMIPGLIPPDEAHRAMCAGVYPDLEAAWREIAKEGDII